MSEKLLIEKAYDFTKWVLERMEKFRKSQRFALAARTNSVSLDLFEGIGVPGVRHFRRLPPSEHLTDCCWRGSRWSGAG